MKQKKKRIGEPEAFKLEMRNLEARRKLGLVAVETYLKQKKVLSEDAAPARVGLQSIIDKAADCIEFGLDKMGNAIIFPIKRIVDVSAAIFKIVNWKVKR